MNFLEIVSHIVNKVLQIAYDYTNLYPLTQARILTSTYYVNLFDNIMNKFVVYSNTIVNNLINLETSHSNNINDFLFLIMLISLIYIIPNILFVYLSNFIIKHSLCYLDLFFTIPQKISWKYYTNCENFLFLMQMNDSNIANNIDNSSTNSNSNEEIEIDVQTKKKVEQVILSNNKRSSEDKTLKASYSIASLIGIGLVGFITSMSLFLFNYFSNKTMKSEFSNKFIITKVYGDLIDDINNLDIISNEYFLQENKQILQNSNNKDNLINTYKNIKTSIEIRNEAMFEQRINNKNNTFQNLFNLLNSDVGVCNRDFKLINTTLCDEIPNEYKTLTNLILFYSESIISLYSSYLPSEFSSRMFINQKYIKIMKIKKGLLVILRQLFNTSIENINELVTDFRTSLMISLILYSFLVLFYFLFCFIFIVRESISTILNSKCTLLLLDSEDLKSTKSILVFLNNEVNISNTT